MLKNALVFHVIFTVLFIFIFSGIRSQSRDTGISTNQDSIMRRIMELEKSLIETNKILLEQKQEEEIQKLLDEAERLSSKPEVQKIDISKKYFSGVRQQQGLNPNISFGMDFFGGVSSSDAGSVNDPGNISYGNNGIFLREAQVSFVAPLDPFTRGRGFLSATPEGFGVDEAYLEWLNLPFNTILKTGIFKPEFGLLNRYHNHALPQFDKPPALVNLFELEGLGGPGISSNIMLPAVIAHATSLDLSVIYASSPQSFMPDSAKDFIFTGQFLNYYDLSASSYLEVRLSGAAGKNSHPGGNHNSYVGSAGISYKWAPVGREKYRTLEWKTEFLYSNQEYSGGNYQSMGFYSSVQNKLDARFWVSGRIGYSEIPYDPSQYEWDFVLSLDFWQSEFVLTRCQYQYNDRNISVRKDVTGPFPSDHSFIVQVVWVMGPHKHESY